MLDKDTEAAVEALKYIESLGRRAMLKGLVKDKMPGAPGPVDDQQHEEHEEGDEGGEADELEQLVGALGGELGEGGEESDPGAADAGGKSPEVSVLSVFEDHGKPKPKMPDEPAAKAEIREMGKMMKAKAKRRPDRGF